MDAHDRELVQEIVKATIQELKRSGLLRNVTSLAYTEATSLLRAYYKRGEDDAAVRGALGKPESDPYFKILPLYFGYSYTIEDIAEVFDVEPSTISRNKKRLCLEVYKALDK